MASVDWGLVAICVFMGAVLGATLSQPVWWGGTNSGANSRSTALAASENEVATGGRVPTGFLHRAQHRGVLDELTTELDKQAVIADDLEHHHEHVDAGAVDTPGIVAVHGLSSVLSFAFEALSLSA